MIMTLDNIVDILFELIKPTGIKTHRYRAPDNAKGTYVVINPLTVIGSRVQNGAINVNLYTDNLNIGNGDTSQPNVVEIRNQSNILLPILNGDWLPSKILLDINSQQNFYEEKQTFTNFKLNFTFYNY